MENLYRLLGRQQWIRFGIRDRIIRKHRHPDHTESQPFIASLQGYKYEGNLNNFLDWSLFYYGLTQREYQSFLRRLIMGVQEPVFLDIGANVGQFSLYMSRTCNVVHAFDPNPHVLARLDHQIKLNGITNIHTHNVGLGELNEGLMFYYPSGANWGTGSFIPGLNTNSDDGTMLSVVNGDEYLADLALSKIDLVKIDVEGFERQVLHGMAGTLEQFRPIVAMEFSSETQSSFGTASALLQSFPDGYEIHKVVANRPILGIFNAADGVLSRFDFDIAGGDIIALPKSSQWT